MEDCLFPKSNDRQACSGAFRQINRMSVILRFSLHQFYTIFINQYLEKTWFDIIAKTQRRRVQDRYKEYDGIYLGHYIQYFFWFFCGTGMVIIGLVIFLMLVTLNSPKMSNLPSDFILLFVQPAMKWYNCFEKVLFLLGL